MEKVMMKYVGAALVAVGFILIAGAAGSDCDGKCLPGMSIGEIVAWPLAGFATAGIGSALMMKE